jgi:glycosyltransferase involved in cell wall biosynthesis
MKVAFIGQKGIPAKFGGIERHVEELTVRLAGLGVESYVYTRPWYTDKGRTGYKGVHLISLPSINTKHLDAISHTFFATLHAVWMGVDVIHYHGVGPSLLAFLPKLLFSKAQVVTTFHCIDRFHQKWGWFARKMLFLGEWAANKFADKTIVVSRGLQQYCKNVFENDTVYNPNGVMLHQEPVDEDYNVLSELNIEANEYFIFIARLVKHKGAHHVIKAFKQLDTNKKLLIVGASAFTDSYAQSLHTLAADDSRVVFAGARSGGQLRVLFENAYTMVHPSESEGLSIAVLEGMAYGKCVIASDIPENAEILEGHGVMFENTNVDQLAQSIQWALNNPTELTELGQIARKHVDKYYNWAKIAKHTQKIYKKLVS